MPAAPTPFLNGVCVSPNCHFSFPMVCQLPVVLMRSACAAWLRYSGSFEAVPVFSKQFSGLAKMFPGQVSCRLFPLRPCQYASPAFCAQVTDVAARLSCLESCGNSLAARYGPMRLVLTLSRSGCG